MNFLDDLCEDVWLNKYQTEAAHIIEFYMGELNEYHYLLLEETIFGVNESYDDTETIYQGTY